MNKKTNLSYVREGFDKILPALENYIGYELIPVFGQNAWKVILEKLNYDPMLPVSGKYEDNIHKLDIANCLRLIDRLWIEVFKRKQSIDFRTYSKELMGVRNDVSHPGSEDLSTDDAWRDLDTMRRLIEPIDQSVADEIGDLLRELRYGSKEGSANLGELSKEVKKQPGIMQKLDIDLPSWRDIIEPHPDVARGLYQKAEFAADLAQVARHDRRTAIEYSDPVEFFNRTYVTEGMKGLLVQALDRITHRGGNPVIQLKTAFGGGKTHSMLALYHMLGGGIPLRKAAALEPVLKEVGLNYLPKANIAVLVGTSLDPSMTKRPNDFPGITVNTLWGEMAMQLARNAGNPKLYDIIKEADKKHVSPGSEKLKELLDEAGPCLILMDELVAYGKKLYGRDDLPAGTFDNFITFIQELTEAARASEDSMVVASIPESENEIGGDAGQKTLEAIEHTFGRMETIWKPVGLNEGFEVVRRRLFKECNNPEARDEVCQAFSNLYEQEKEHFPYEVRDLDYLQRMKECYPIHPEIFDRLFNDWSTLERFQRTRGVLRLMASVIHALWMGGDASAMIVPGTLPLAASSVRDELTRTLPDAGWNSIILSEVDGKNSVPYKIDSEKEYLGKLMAARRVARMIFLGSAPSSREQALRGMDIKQIHLGVVQPGEPVSRFDDALGSLRTKCAYLNSGRNNDRYWYDLRPTLLKTANDRIAQVKTSEAMELIEKQLRKLIQPVSDFAGYHICPKSSADVVDEQRTRLVILRPDQTYSEKEFDCKALLAAEDILNYRGQTPRKYRNTLLFLAPESKLISATLQAAREIQGWKSIRNDKNELNLDQKQIREVEEQIANKEDNLTSRIRELYTIELAPTVEPDEPKTVNWDRYHLTGADQSIMAKAGTIARDTEAVVENLAPIVLQQNLDVFVWNQRDVIQISELWNYLTTYLYMPRLKDIHVLQQCLIDGVADKNFFGLASGIEQDKLINLKYAKPVSNVYLTDYLVEPSKAAAYTPPTPERPIVTPPGTPPSSDPHEEPEKVRYFSMETSNFDPIRINRQLNNIANEIVALLRENSSNQVKVTLSVEAFSPDGFSISQQRALAENCRNLRIDDFELDTDK